MSQVRFTLLSVNGGNKNSDVSISEISSETKNAVLTQAQNYQKLIKITHMVASVGSEHWTKTYNDRVQLLEKILENWELGGKVETITKEEKIFKGR